MIIRTIAKKETAKRVAAYARVSTMSESQDESFNRQRSYYTDFISQQPNWSLVNIYADRGITGTSAEKRPGFQQMIRDAKAGKIDLILCKSISRFSRNYEEAQKYTHLLKALGIEVQFEKEGVSTNDPQTDMILGTLMAVAQQESKSISDNLRWTNQRLAEQGIHHVGSNHLLGYDEVNGEMTPNKDRWIIELIFQRYAEGTGVTAILDELKAKGAKTLRTGNDFKCSNIISILRNEVYCGDRNILKSAARNYLTKKVDPSLKRKSHYVSNHHEGIVSRQLWDAAQERLKLEKASKQTGSRPRKDHHPFFDRVICAACGQPYRRCLWKNRRGETTPMWKCNGRAKGECYARIVREYELKTVMAKAERVKVTEFGLEAV